MEGVLWLVMPIETSVTPSVSIEIYHASELFEQLKWSLFKIMIAPVNKNAFQ